MYNAAFTRECVVSSCNETCSVFRSVVTLAHRAPRGDRGAATTAAAGAAAGEPPTPPAASAVTPRASYLQEDSQLIKTQVHKNLLSLC